MLDVTERPVLIVGGGTVGARKARGLLKAMARRVRVVSPTFDPFMPQGVERIESPYNPVHLDGCHLVFAATDRPEVNEAVVREARRRGILVCRADADEEEPGDFSTPAVLREGPLTVTVSAGGSPALAARIRDEVAQRLDPAWVRLAEAVLVLRPRVLAVTRLTADQRKAIFRELASDAAGLAAAGGTETVWAWLLARCPELVSHV